MKIIKSNIQSLLKTLSYLSLVLVISTACDNSAEQSKSQDISTTSEKDSTIKEVKEEVVDTKEAFKDYAFTKKQDLVSYANQQLAKVDARIDKLNSKAADISDEVKESQNKAVTTARQKREDLKTSIDNLQSSSKDAWSDLKTGFKNALDEAKKGVKDAEDSFEDDEK